MHETHFKGIIGELAFTTHLLKRGYQVLTPINPNSSYDLVVETEGTFKRIQVKYCTPKNGTLRVELDRPMRQTKSYKERDVDMMGVYDSKHEKCYLIPINHIKSHHRFYLRIQKTKNFQGKLVHLATNYEI